MEEKELKTSPKQRFFIIVIAVIMLGSIIASYAAIIINGGASKGGSNESQIDEAKILEYENNYNAKLAEFKEATKGDYSKFVLPPGNSTIKVTGYFTNVTITNYTRWL